MLIVGIIFSTISIVLSNDLNLDRTNLNCSGRAYKNVTLTAYYPDYESDNEADYLDNRGKKLRSLQDYIDGRGNYVTAGIDLPGTGIDYGTNLCIPELNKHFGIRIPLQARDYDSNLENKAFTRLDICVRTDVDSYDKAVNRLATLYV